MMTKRSAVPLPQRLPDQAMASSMEDLIDMIELGSNVETMMWPTGMNEKKARKLIKLIKDGDYSYAELEQDPVDVIDTANL